MVKIENSGGSRSDHGLGPDQLGHWEHQRGRHAAAPTKPVTASGVATFAGCAITGTAGNYNLGDQTRPNHRDLEDHRHPAGHGHPAGLHHLARVDKRLAFGGQPVVKVEDSGGNVVTSASGTMTATINTGTGCAITAGSTATISSGVATFSALTMTGVAGNSYSLHFSNGTCRSTSGSFTMTFGNATKLVIATEPSSTDTGGAALATQPVVEVEDSAGNVVTSVNSGTASASIASGSGGSIAAGGTSAHLLVRRGHLLEPGPQRRERHRLHLHLHR